MPHVSKRKLSKKQVQELEERLMLFLGTTTVKTRQEIFRELLTETEQIMLAKRLTILHLLSQGETTYSIHEAVGVSPSTIARFDRAIQRKRFRRTLEWLRRNARGHAALRALADLFARPFDARRSSLKSVIEDTI